MPIRVFNAWMNLAPGQADELAEVGRRYNVAVQSNDEADHQGNQPQALRDRARGARRAQARSRCRWTRTPPARCWPRASTAQPLPEEMIVGTIRQVLVVGIIAPTVMIGSIAVHLSRHPELQQHLRANPQLSAAATEEFLRLYTPYRGFARTARVDVTLHGRTIPAGEPIALVYASANRDEDVFADAASFRLDRPNMKESVAFGRGPHMCLGAPLARLRTARRAGGTAGAHAAAASRSPGRSCPRACRRSARCACR